MSVGILTFLRTTFGDHLGPWDADTVRATSQLHPPDRIYGGREELLRGDAHFIWARWFLESLCDPSQFEHKRNPYGQIFSQTVAQLRQLMAGTPDDEIRLLASPIAEIVLNEVRKRQYRGREPISISERQRVIDESSGNIRCWICGYAFTEAAIRRFLKEDDREAPINSLLFVDYMTQKGKITRDLSIELDHVLPVAAGGTGGLNLRVACGWCNRHKSDNISLYDQAFKPLLVRHPTLGAVTIPRPFWIVRLLAFRRRCEWTGAGGCVRNSSNTELFIAACREGGALNPTNLMVTCDEHDPIKANRLVNARKLCVID